MFQQKFFSRDSNLRNSSVSPFVCLSVCLSVTKLSKQLHISSLPLSMLASYLNSLCQAIRLSSISLQLLLAISLVYVRPSGLGLRLSSSCQLYHQSMLGHQDQLHLSLAHASYLISLCQVIRLSSISLQLLLAISLVYVRPSGLAPSLSSSASYLISLCKAISLSASLSVVSSKGIATVSFQACFIFGSKFFVFQSIDTCQSTHTHHTQNC